MPINPIDVVGGIAIGTGVGGAVEAVVEPQLQNLKNTEWAVHQDKPLDPGTAAEVAAEEVDLYATMETQASYSGIDKDRFADLYRVTLTAPGVGTLIELLRRNDEAPIDFTHGLRKAKLGNQWDQPLANLKDVRIPAPDLAYMVVRDLVPNPFSGSGPTGPDDTAIDDIPQLAIDTKAEAAKTGWDPLRFEALVGRSGLAPAPILAANAYFRKIITWDQYRTIIAKGDLRPAYTNVILNAARQILTAGEYSEAQLRGYSTAGERLANTAKHGMSPADSDLLHLIQGRPIAVHQVATGLARGGTYGGLYTDVPEPYQDAIRQSNIKEPWARLAYTNRYSYPSAFVLRSLAQGGELTPGETNGALLAIGWPPDLAAKVTGKWTGATLEAATIPVTVAEAEAAWGTGAQAKTSDPHVTKAQNQLWTTVHKSYVDEETDDATATQALTTLGVAPASIPSVLALWQAERALIRKQLSAAQVKKAFSEAVINPATGVAWTKQDALDALIQRGYTLNDANTMLEL